MAPVLECTANDSLYEQRIAGLRSTEFTSLTDSTLYLDHAGTTLYPVSLIRRFSQDLTSTLYANTHSSSPAALASAQRIDHVRHAALRFFGADPDHFDLVFVANATAGAKLVGDAFGDAPGGFAYGYHRDSHTSLIGLRELASPGARACLTDEDLLDWAMERGPRHAQRLWLLSYPAQSGLNGRRLPREWCRAARRAGTYTLLDAAAYASTTPLHLSDPDESPDFTLVSFNKIFGFPHLGAVIARRASADILLRRKYFGGGTVDMVLALGDEWHAKSRASVHDTCEDGTLPIHNIIALGHALSIHQELYTSIHHVSRHTTLLAARLHSQLLALHHPNKQPLVRVFGDAHSTYGDPLTQGPIIALHILDAHGQPVDILEVEKLASVHNIHLRTGSVCNPAGTAAALSLSPAEMRHNHALGFQCAHGGNLASGRPAGVVRLSLGAMSTLSDIERLVAFFREFFLQPTPPPPPPTPTPRRPLPDQVYIASLTIYPIKSCAGFAIPPTQPWRISPRGLAYDRTWCLIHASTGAPLSMKQHPRMTLLTPSIDLAHGVLRIAFGSRAVDIPLDADADSANAPTRHSMPNTSVLVRRCARADVARFLSDALGVECWLARLEPARSPSPSSCSTVPSASDADDACAGSLANTAPLLLISRASVAYLSSLLPPGSQAIHEGRFRANIVIAPGGETGSSEGYAAYQEDGISRLVAPDTSLELSTPCRRCAVVNIDPATGEKGREPFATLARTRRVNGLVVFGRHASLRGKGVVRVGMCLGVE